MSIWQNLILLLMLLAAGSSSAAKAPTIPTNAPARIELSDQFQREQKLSFPSARVVLLTIADRKGSDHIAAWVEAAHQRFGNQIEIAGIADLSTVPAPLRSTVRKRFKESMSHPVMLDWSGAAVKSFGYVPPGLEVMCLDRTGKILQRWRGAATANKLEELRRVLERTLAPTAPK